MFDVGGGELILILLVVLLLFGPNKLPELARSVGKGIRTMRKAQEDLTQQIRDISADVSAPVTQVRDDIKKNITVSLDPDAVPRERKADGGDQGAESGEQRAESGDEESNKDEGPDKKDDDSREA